MFMEEYDIPNLSQKLKKKKKTCEWDIKSFKLVAERTDFLLLLLTDPEHWIDYVI